MAWNMGYYGTYGSTYTLAGVIQGEAQTPSGQFAVASVIQNRMDGVGGGYVGAGTGNVQSVVTPSQFNGFQTPTPQSMAYAQAIQNGTLSQYGNTGNATFYAAPVANNAAWANPSTASGQGLFNAGNNSIADEGTTGNHFSDTLGPPSSNFQMPQYGGGTPQAPSTYNPYSNQGFSNALDNSQDTRENQDLYGYSDSSTGAGGATGTIAPAGNTPVMGSTSVQDGIPIQNYNPATGKYDGSVITTPQGGELTQTPATSGNPDDLGTINIPKNGGDIASAGPTPASGTGLTGSGPMGETPGYDGMTASQSYDAQENLQMYGYSPDATTQPFTQATPNAQAGTNSTAYAGDMMDPQAIDTLARSVAASAQSQNQATASAANTLGQGLSGVGSSIQQGAKQTSSATNSLAQTVAGATGSAIAAATNRETALFSFSSNLFVRTAVVILGAIFIAAALHMFGATQNTVIDPVTVGKRAARAGGKVAEVAA